MKEKPKVWRESQSKPDNLEQTHVKNVCIYSIYKTHELGEY